MKSAFYYRRDIPFFHNKSEAEFQRDIYERYDDMVLRQTALHLADELWGSYPWRPMINFAEQYYPMDHPQDILEIGCGVGRWIAMLSKRYPKASCWGLDYSYQMCKRAQEYWVMGKGLTLDLMDRGHSTKVSLEGHRYPNLYIGLAKAENLPMADNTQDLIVSSFLLDRLEEPVLGLKEMYRALRPKGNMILCSPLNYTQEDHWNTLYPINKLLDAIEGIGYTILHHQDNLIVKEPLDKHGNHISWQCIGIVATKV